MLMALIALFSIRKYTFDLKKEEKIFLAIIILHVVSTIISNVLAGWTPASHGWFFSGDVRFIFAIPVYFYLRTIPGIWKYFLLAVPFGAIVIGLTGIIDFMMRYMRGDVEGILAEGVYGHIFQGNISALWSILSYAAFDYYKDNNKMRMLCISGAVLGAVGALVSVTRNAWLSLILLYFIVFFIQGGAINTFKSLGLKKVSFIGMTLVAVLYFLSGIEYVNTRLMQTFEEPIAYFNADRSKEIEYTSLAFRLEQWRGSLHSFKEKPVFGHGVGNAGVVHNRYIKEGKLNSIIYQDSAKRGNATHVHSAYFGYLGDTGIVGLVLILLLLFYPILVAIKNRSEFEHSWKFQILLSAAFIIGSLTEHPFIRNNWTSIFIVSSMVIFIWLNKEDGHISR